MINTYPPNPELVETKDAAKIWGCSPSHLRTVMQAYGVEPVREYVKTSKRGGVMYLWNPAAVLQIRKVHALNKASKKRTPPAPVVKAQRRMTKMETDRQKLWERIASRHGITVEKLRIDNANGIVYR